MRRNYRKGYLNASACNGTSFALYLSSSKRTESHTRSFSPVNPDCEVLPECSKTRSWTGSWNDWLPCTCHIPVGQNHCRSPLRRTWAPCLASPFLSMSSLGHCRNLSGPRLPRLFSGAGTPPVSEECHEGSMREPVSSAQGLEAQWWRVLVCTALS